MRVKIIYENPQNPTIHPMYQQPPVHLKVKLNKGPIQDLRFNHHGVAYLENAEINKTKRNTIQFRHVAPDEEEQKRGAIMSNIFRGIIFVLLIIILPFAFMSFKSVRVPFNKARFNYVEGHDFVLWATFDSFAYRIEPAQDEYFATTQNTYNSDPFATAQEVASTVEEEFSEEVW
ncbi:MAG: hypothetical protein FWE13_04595 [Firmicutes bacterium]|nr:hypothetical protein [Bacillota bacterium]